MMATGFMTTVLQHPPELDQFVEIVKRENVRSYLEIGCKFGGSLWRIGKILPRGSRLVAVDLPHGDHMHWKHSQPHLETCIKHLVALGYDAHLFLGDSTNAKIVEKVCALGPFDLCLIDANHTEAFVRKDWANYGPMARIVAFHDIAWKTRPGWEMKSKVPIEVPRVWNELKQGYRHQEIMLDPTGQDNGFGILWR